MSQLNFFPPADFFVETGTGDGVTLGAASSHYLSCLSVELNFNQYLKNCVRFALNPNIRLYYGYTSLVLPCLLPPLLRHKVVFWLDAHYTDAPCPLLDELRAILAVPWETAPQIFIDDFNGFHGNIPGWPRIEEIDELMSGWKRAPLTDSIFTYQKSI